MNDTLDLAKSVKPIDAYHGSPYEFDQFDPAHAGKGEGNALYGHGMYFSGDEDVARQYRNSLTNKVKYKGKLLGEAPSEGEGVDKARMNVVHDMLNGISAKDSIAKRAQDLRQMAQQARQKAESTEFPKSAYERMENIKHAEQLEQFLPFYDKLDPSHFEKPSGHMYHVQIGAKPETFAHWNKPLAEQHPLVRSAMNDLAAVHGPMDEKDTIETIYNNLSKKVGNKMSASNRMLASGIKGIKYIDPNSKNRPAEDQTHNYVVFDPKDINVMRRYARGGNVELWNENHKIHTGGLSNSPIVQHVLDKIGASLPATMNHFGSVTGRRH
jgi:hypothetical protein